MKQIPPGFLDGGAGLNKGHPFPNQYGAGAVTLPDILNSAHSIYANAAAVAALPKSDWNGVIVVGGKPYGWQPASTSNDSTSQLFIRPSALSVSDPGRFELLSQSTALRLPVTFSTANNTVLFTVPTGWKLALTRLYYELTASFTGAGAVGASSSNAAYSTAGDLIGGATGDLAAALTAGIRGGTLGAKFGSNGAVQLTGGDTIKWDVITPGYAAGAGDLIVLVTRT